MFSWCENRPHPTPDREVGEALMTPIAYCAFLGLALKPQPEAEMLPLVAQTFSAVEWLHAFGPEMPVVTHHDQQQALRLGIAHRDLSLENLLLTGYPDCCTASRSLLLGGVFCLISAACLCCAECSLLHTFPRRQQVAAPDWAALGSTVKSTNPLIFPSCRSWIGHPD